MSIFSERLVTLRKEKGLSQNELAKSISISPACINRWEKGLRTANIDSIVLLCKFFNCSADFLLGIIDW